ncbi:membrane protein regulator of flagellar synthesis [Alkalihalophilus pseudofirmus OF4]|uniref:Membrane protein regulator of flagellar synthesis n=1 Tax=Alkalihalophilus pseudofirmus (strain ATCC BAA-2126 / JCM 17055 / OF4) TaxID=398511 RepID=D3FYH3_ALKPO|nr:TIGR03826 family flagellar region protein [Alkalihalophilus pseudofirmus]ADC49196.1 membrane protein regulator of flagellar synthesis [Alkalihalophilus pseudofirmus OF4]
MKNVANCPKCGALFVKALRPLCNACYKEQEENYDKVSRFMRRKQNRMASIREVHEKTEVPLEQIHQFVKEGRILVTHFPNMGYPCESCGALIQEGRICESCKGNITGGLEQIQKEKEFKERVAENLKAEESAQNKTYHSLDDRFDK